MMAGVESSYSLALVNCPAPALLLVRMERGHVMSVCLVKGVTSSMVCSPGKASNCAGWLHRGCALHQRTQPFVATNLLLAQTDSVGQAAEGGLVLL